MIEIIYVEKILLQQSPKKTYARPILTVIEIPITEGGNNKFPEVGNDGTLTS